MSSNTSWNYIPTPHFQPTPLRLLAPIRPPDTSAGRDKLPSPPYSPTPPPQSIPYVLTTHVIPAALPRVSPNVPVPTVPQMSSKDEQREANVKGFEDIRQLRGKYVRGELGVEGSEKGMVNLVNRYVHRELLGGKAHRERGVTLMFVHANGFPKEIWEPIIERLLSYSSTVVVVDEVWLWEAIQHGDSYLLNAAQLDGVFSWHDNARDIANFLLHYLPSTPGGVLPTHLTAASATVSQQRQTHGFRERTLVAAGQSYGGCCLTFAALTFPALFDSLICVEPVIMMPGRCKSIDDNHANMMIRAVVGRRDGWSSREEAFTSLRKSPVCKLWHPSVLRKFCDRGIHHPTDLARSSSTDPTEGVKNGSGPAKLKLPGIQEGVVVMDTTTMAEVFQLLPLLDKRIELRWVMPGRKEEMEIGGAGHGNILCWRRPENSSNIRIPKAGHLIVQEAPDELADDIAAFLDRKYGRGLSGKTMYWTKL